MERWLEWFVAVKAQARGESNRRTNQLGDRVTQVGWFQMIGFHCIFVMGLVYVL